jgi:hypothetical protein
MLLYSNLGAATRAPGVARLAIRSPRHAHDPNEEPHWHKRYTVASSLNVTDSILAASS